MLKNVRLRRTGLWFLSDISQLHRNVRERVAEQEKTLTYGSQTDGPESAPPELQSTSKSHISRGSEMALLTDVIATTVCFIDFGDPVLGNPL